MNIESMAINVYQYDEIIRRIIDSIRPLEEMTGYPYEIKMYADNASAPPCVEVSIYEWRKDRHCVILYYIIYQNTSVSMFDDMLKELHHTAVLCNTASLKKTSYNIEKEEERKKSAEIKTTTCDDMPF